MQITAETGKSRETLSHQLRKRRSSVPALVDNKRKHLERNLSVAQQGKLLLDEAKEDAMFRREMTEAVNQSTKSFSDFVERLSFSLEVMAGGISK